ncbi:MAG: 16S rRNA (cytosine(1402)-N(4))-methyltransferase RsmH [Spirochaetaceae bacterium]|nr:16S rRNA (cytosine(1402)-N(4))-methyltransferase RsmH [Spirochaetaceae bacterium]
MTVVHTPVLPEELIRFLATERLSSPAGEYMVDCTLGEGGHSAVFLSHFPNLRITGIDADKEIIKVARERLKEFGGRIEFYRGWAQDFLRQPGAWGAPGTFPVNGQPGIILLDLGVSLYHYQKGDRGFSFRGSETLDMRIDTENGLSAAEILASYSETVLADMLFFNAEERFSRRIARSIVEARRRAAITDTCALERIVWDAVPAACRHRRLHPATKVFQALRVEANGELKKLPGLLETAFSALRPGGRLGVITFNSLEDRIVKNFFRAKAGKSAAGFRGNSETPIVKEALLLTAKPVLPSREELLSNPPSRSAKLRALQKL